MGKKRIITVIILALVVGVVLYSINSRDINIDNKVTETDLANIQEENTSSETAALNTDAENKLPGASSSNQESVVEKANKILSLINELDKQSSSEIKIKQLEANSKVNESIDEVGHKSTTISDDNLEIELDGQGELERYINKEKLYSNNGKNNSNVKELEQLKSIAKNIMRSFNVNFYDEEKFPSEFGNDGYICFVFSRNYEGYAFDLDAIRIVLDSSTGEIVSIVREFSSGEPQINIKVSEEDARKTAIASREEKDIASIKLLIVNPNGRNSRQNSISRLAYVVTFEDNIFIWIDAENNTILDENQTKKVGVEIK